MHTEYSLSGTNVVQSCRTGTTLDNSLDAADATSRSSILREVSMHVTDPTRDAKGNEYVPGPF